MSSVQCGEESARKSGIEQMRESRVAIVGSEFAYIIDPLAI